MTPRFNPATYLEDREKIMLQYAASRSAQIDKLKALAERGADQKSIKKAKADFIAIERAHMNYMVDLWKHIGQSEREYLAQNADTSKPS